MLKEERVNLMTENEELYGKVRAAQTLSRKDSVKTKEFERELAHIKDEFERLRLAYEGTKGQLEAMEVKNTISFVYIYTYMTIPPVAM